MIIIISILDYLNLEFKTRILINQRDILYIGVHLDINAEVVELVHAKLVQSCAVVQVACCQASPEVTHRGC